MGVVAPTRARALTRARLAPALMARAMGWLYGAGGTLALLTVALPHSRKASEPGLLAVIALAYLVAVVLYTRASRVSRLGLQLGLALGSTLIAAVAYFSGQAPSPLVLFYLWVFLYAAYFFSTVETALQVSYAAILYGALLLVTLSLAHAAEWWLVGTGTLLVAAALVRVMSARFDDTLGELYDAARTDPLTGLANRRGFREQLDLELERARRSAAPMSILVGDLDRFKDVNARAGQLVGDAALRRVAAVLGAGKRKLDAVARVGGEEFALILPDTSAHEAFVIAERLRTQVASELGGDTVALTVSFGVASYPQSGPTAASLLRAADAALHAAKMAGADRTVIYSEALGGHVRADREARDIAGERFVSVVLELAEAVDVRFSGTARHSETVGRYAEMMARELGLPAKRVERVRLAGMLHDVGKVAVPNEILQKPGKLTDEEYEIIKRHPELGGQILDHPALADVRSWVAAHHERPDGRGYPLGLRDPEIPLEAKILSVADAYEAMTSDRAYRASLGPMAAREELERCAGSQFDARVVRALLAVLQREAARAGSLLAGS